MEKKDKPSIIVCIILFLVFMIIGVLFGDYILYAKRTERHSKAIYCRQAYDCNCPKEEPFCECTYCVDDECMETDKVECSNMEYYWAHQGDRK